MSQDLIQVNYEQLQDVARRFQVQADSCAELRTAVNRALHPLQQGGWIGKGAAAFFSEMDSDLFPALERLHSAMILSGNVVQEAIATFKAAEEEAGLLFQAGAAGAAGAAGSSHKLDYTSATEEQRKDNAKKVFSESYMSGKIGQTWKGEGDPRLGKAMETLRKNAAPEECAKALDVIADLRGLDRATVGQQYESFKQLQQQSISHGGAVEELVSGLHDGYMGSRDQLRYGQVVGDVLGIDPVFGAMLNPTGGMPGPGEKAIRLDNFTLSYHSAFHDAAGYLYNHFEAGPGYDYLGLEGRPTNDPFTGQESGIKYWSNKFHDDSFVATTANSVGTALGKAEDVKNWLNDTAQSTYNWFAHSVLGK